LLFACYRKFFTLRHALRNMRYLSPHDGNGVLGEMMGNMAMSFFIRFCAWRRTHPMSGGVARVWLDGAKDFISLRKETFGFELAPLPRSLQLSAADSWLNGGIKSRVWTSMPQAAAPPLAVQFQAPVSGIPAAVSR